MRELAFWKALDAALDPLRLPPAEHFQARYEARPDGPYQRILEDLELAENVTDPRILLCGARGSGKTTELVALRRAIPERVHANTLYVDAAAALPDDAPTLAWLPLVAAAIRRARGVGAQPEDRLLAALSDIGIANEAFATLTDFVGAVATYSGHAELAPAVGVGRAVSELGRAAKSWLASTRTVEPEQAEAFAAALREEIGLLHEETAMPLVLLIDGFDRRSSAESVFTALEDADLLYGLPAALILSGPTQLRFDPRFSALNLPAAFRTVSLDNLPVVHPDGSDDEAGQDVLVRLLRRRVADLDVGDLFLEEPLRRAARFSSGLPREFLELLRLAARSVRRREAETIEAQDLDTALRERRHAYQSGLGAEAWDTLAQVHRTRERPTSRADDLLFTNHVACYPNGDVWFRPNELLVDYLDARPERGT